MGSLFAKKDDRVKDKPSALSRGYRNGRAARGESEKGGGEGGDSDHT